MQQHFDLGVLPVEAVLLVADVLDGLAGHVLDVLESEVRPAHFAGDDDAVGGAERLGGDADDVRVHAGFRPLTEKLVDDLVGDSVADFIGMAFGNRFAGEKIVLPRHFEVSTQGMAPRASLGRRLHACSPSLAHLPARARYVKPQWRERHHSRASSCVTGTARSTSSDSAKAATSSTMRFRTLGSRRRAKDRLRWRPSAVARKSTTYWEPSS